MNAAVAENTVDTMITTRHTTTLFDLIASMQDQSVNTTDDVRIALTITDWIHSGRIQFQNNVSTQVAA
jgi:hypothetical protein